MLTLATAQAIVARIFEEGRALGLKPLGVVVLDARGAPKAVAIDDGSSLDRYTIAHGKARGAVGFGVGSRGLARRATEQPAFIAAVTAAFGGALIPVPGGVLIRDREGALLGAVGVSGDSSDNDEKAAVIAIEAAGLVADTGG